MKSRKLLAAFLSVVMLICSCPAFVLAEGDEGTSGEVVTSEQLEAMEALTEDEYFIKGGIPYNSTYSVKFTPQTTAEYTYIVDNTSEPTVTVTDQYGTALVPNQYVAAYLGAKVDIELEAGKTYIFTVSATSFDHYKPCTMLIMKKPTQITSGNNKIIVQSDTYTHIPFTPSESGAYVLTISGDLVTDENGPSVYVNLYKDGEYVGLSSVSLWSDQYITMLEADVTYDVSIRAEVDGGGKHFFCVTNVEFSRDFPAIVEGEETTVTRGSKNDIPVYSFTPETDGVYTITSVGDIYFNLLAYDSSFLNAAKGEYGEGGSRGYRYVACMRGGQTYYISMTTWEAENKEVSFPILIEKAGVISEGYTEFPDEQDLYPFYAFTPTASDYYLITNPSSGGGPVLGTYPDRRFFMGDIMVHYLEKDQLYYVGGEGDFYIATLEDTLTEGTDTEISRQMNDHMYALFTPTVTDAYTFEFTMQEGYPSFNYARVYPLSTNTGADCLFSYKDNNSGFGKYSYYLQAGQTYLFDLNMDYFSNIADTATVSVIQDGLLELFEGKNESLLFSQYANYTFTPTKTGLYEFYYPSTNDFNISNEFSYMSEYGDNYRSILYLLQEGQTYRLSASSYVEEHTDFYINEVPAIAEGGNEIAKRGETGFATFTPLESGVYYFSCEDATISSAYRVDGPTDFGYISLTSSNGKYSAYFEAGATYAFQFKAKSSHSSDTFDIVVAMEIELKVGNNTNVFIGKAVDWNRTTTYYTFSVEKGGTYTFHAQSDLSFGMILYKSSDLNTEIGRGYQAYDTGEMNMTVTLEAGVLYRIALSTEEPDDIFVDLDVEEAVAGKLGGYSLSLDGSIAVNLYLTVADYVAASDTAVLKCTNSDGKVVATYKVKDAEVKTRNNITYSVFRIPMAAKQMNDTFYAQIVDEANGVTSEKYSVAVVDYAAAILNSAYDKDGNIVNQEYAAVVPLVKALLNYGSRAQTYYNHNPFHPANEYLKDPEDRKLPAVSPASIPQYNAATDAKLPEGLTFYGASLAIESDTGLSFYFINGTGKEVTYSEATSGIVNSKGRASGDYTFIYVPGIPAHKLGEKIHVSIHVAGDDTEYYVEYSPLNYCYNVLKRDAVGERTEALKNLLQAFYVYNQAAVHYETHKQG